MKKLMMVLTLITSLSALANIDEAVLAAMEPTDSEISQSRACFQEMAVQGCGHPKEDLEHFKKCMGNVSASLTPACKKMLTDLYGK